PLLPSHAVTRRHCGILCCDELRQVEKNFSLFPGASSCIFPSIITAPAPSGIVSTIFLANATSLGSGEKTFFAISICEGWSDQAPRQPIRNALRNCTSHAAGSEKSPNGP